MEDQVDAIEGEDWSASPRIHPQHHAAARASFFGSGTYANWLALAAFLVSFGVLINNTNKEGEPRIATAMCALGFIFTIWSSSVYFIANWPIQHRMSMIFLLFFVLCFLAVTVWLTVRIWT